MSLSSRLIEFAQAVGADIKSLNALIANKVEMVTGKGLSTNDYTTAEQTKLGTMSSTGQTSITAAATMNIGAAPTEAIIIPGKAGTTQITAFDAAPAGVLRYLYNQGVGAKVLNHNATSLILPGGQNISLTPNSSAIMYSLGSGNWVCLGVTMASGLPITGWTGGTLSAAINEAPVTVKAKTVPTFDLGTVNNANTITMASGDAGTITSLGTQPAGTKRQIMNFTGGDVVFAHNATSMVLPQSRDLVVGYLDVVEFTSEGSGNWRLNSHLVNGGFVYPARIGVGMPGSAQPTARIQIAASVDPASAAGRAHIKLVPQALSTPKEEGTLEYDTNGRLWWGNNVGRRLVASPGFDRVYVNAAATGNVTLNLSSYTVFDLTLTGNTNVDFSSPPELAVGEMFTFTVRITCGATPYTITWPAGVITVWLNTSGAVGTAPAASKMVEFEITTQNGTTAIARKTASN